MSESGGEREQSAEPAEDILAIDDTVLIRELPLGTKIELRNGAIGEVTANPKDGGWVFIRYLESPVSPSKVGEEELVFCTDVIRVV